ncbi:MAG TPA: energy-coupling factor transporter transmembrane component T [bacterium]|nr:energy-coupling factor transporter transmembrane component T [bacterium]
MDLLRSFAFGQYVPGDSVVHRLDPRTKILATVLLAVAVFAIHEVAGLAVFTVFLAAVIAAGRIPPGYILRGLKPVFWLLGFTVVLQILFGESGGHPVVQRGPLLITRENLALGAFYGYRLVLLIVSTTLMTFTTSPVELTDGIERLLRPLRRVGVPVHELALMMTIALRFIPTLLEEAEKIIKAQMARGAEFSRGSPIRRARALVPLLVPLFVSAFRRADALALAMEARCYRGGEHRTRMIELHFRSRDYVALMAIVLTVAVSLAPPALWRAL